MELNIQGEYFSKMDDKHRVKLPAELVEVLGEFMVSRYKDKSIYMVPRPTLEKLMEELGNVPLSDFDKRNAVRVFLRGLSAGVLDKSNRLYVPPELWKYAELKTGDKVCIKGFGDHAVLSAVREENV